MTWEETVQFIRTQHEYKELVKYAYFDENLQLNVERFRNSIEFAETLKLLKSFNKNAETILDIGCGNGISSIAFSLKGYKVTAVEPDPSETVGVGAIRKLINQYKIEHVAIFESFAENLSFKDETFDVVYARQSMHHATDLNKFIYECSRVLKKGGIILTIRDHVIFNEEDKLTFLETHPLQKYYGGENAFTYEEYTFAFQKAGLVLIRTLRTFDSEINFFPMSSMAVKKSKRKKYIGLLISKYFPYLLSKTMKEKINNILNEKDYPGRMYSFIAVKQ